MHKRLKKTLRAWPIIFIAMIGLAFGGPLAMADGAQTINRIVALVNDDIITFFDLEAASQPYLEKVKNMNHTSNLEQTLVEKVRKEVLDRMIQEKLKDQEIRKYNIKVDEAEIDQAMERFKKANSLSDESLKKGLAAEGMTLEEYRGKLKEELLRARLINYEIRSKIVITREEVKAYYDAHADRYAGETRYHLRNIIMFVPEYADDAVKESIRLKMEAVLEKLNQGQSFESMARLYSESSLASEGGNIGFFKLKDLSRQLRDIVPQIKPGEFSNVIDTDQGYQILFVEAINQEEGKGLENATTEIENILYQERVEKKFQEWLGELRKQAHIKIYE